METPENDPWRKRADDATSRRLAKLRATPLDISGLKKAIEAQIPRPPRPPQFFGLRWLNVRAAAASLLVIALIVAIVLHSSGGPVLASPERLAQIHEEISLGGGSHVTHVDSVGAANTVITSAWRGAPTIPELPKDHVISCCMHMMGRKKLACVSFETDGVPITMAVADAADVKLPDSKTLAVAGVSYHVQLYGDINMVMAHRAGRWFCLMGKLPVDRLIRLAGSLQF